ncbi:MAG: flap endonuclease-1 [Candidatus Bathyarchaeota archaeon]|nr:flap endonuclease-1 [Candidatus Bathyarchaeota archaeon]
MGVNLTPIVEKRVVTLEDLRGKSFAVDGFVVLHQFLALIRARDGQPLMDAQGRTTSHLVGFAFRTTRLIADYGMKLIFVFDGRPPQLKRAEVEKRREIRAKFEEEYREAVAAGDYKAAMAKTVMTGRLTGEGIADAKRLLDLLGIPWVQAPSEGEAQAAYMAAKGDVWASNSQDYDSLLFGTPRLVRYITIQGEEWLPSKGRARKLLPEIIDLEAMLTTLQLTREQLIDVGILIGTDFNHGIRGIGPKTALKLIRKHGRLEDLPPEVRDQLTPDTDAIRDLYQHPPATDNYTLDEKPVQEEELVRFLCDERSFSRERVDTVITRMRNARGQRSLSDWFGGV